VVKLVCMTKHDCTTKQNASRIVGRERNFVIWWNATSAANIVPFLLNKIWKLKFYVINLIILTFYFVGAVTPKTPLRTVLSQAKLELVAEIVTFFRQNHDSVNFHQKMIMVHGHAYR